MQIYKVKVKTLIEAAGVAIEDINENGEVVWKLSERELEIIEELKRRGEHEDGGHDDRG